MVCNISVKLGVKLDLRSGLPEAGEQGDLRPPKILASQLTLSQSEGVDYGPQHYYSPHPLPVLRPSDIPEEFCLRMQAKRRA